MSAALAPVWQAWTAAEWVAHYAPLRRAPSRVAGGYRICTLDDVAAKVGSVQTRIESVTNDLKNCPQLDETTQTNWVAFRGEWFKWMSTRDTSFWASRCDELDVAEDFEDRAYRWQLKLKNICVLSAPITVPTQKPPIVEPPGKDMAHAIEVAAVAATVVAVAYMAGPLLRGLAGKK